MNENYLGGWLITTSIQIHRETGPGLLERVYEAILAERLRARGLKVEWQLSIPINYKGLNFSEGFRADLVIKGKVIVELKCVEMVNHAHRKQLLTYLRLTGMRLVYLLNFSAL